MASWKMTSGGPCWSSAPVWLERADSEWTGAGAGDVLTIARQLFGAAFRRLSAAIQN